MKYHFIMHQDTDALWAECVELSGCHTQADTVDELHENMKEALDLYLDEPEDAERLAPLPSENAKGKGIVEVAVDSRIAFGLYMKHLRSRHQFTQKQVADMLGMRNLYSYQRLERKANPSLSLLEKVKSIYPEFRIDDLL